MAIATDESNLIRSMVEQFGLLIADDKKEAQKIIEAIVKTDPSVLEDPAKLERIIKITAEAQLGTPSGETIEKVAETKRVKDEEAAAERDTPTGVDRNRPGKVKVEGEIIDPTQITKEFALAVARPTPLPKVNPVSKKSKLEKEDVDAFQTGFVGKKRLKEDKPPAIAKPASPFSPTIMKQIIDLIEAGGGQVKDFLLSEGAFSGGVSGIRKQMEKSKSRPSR